MDQKSMPRVGHNSGAALRRWLHALSRYWRLLARYLRPQWPWMSLLAVILCGAICVQVVTPLVASHFIDQATSGGDMRNLTRPGAADHGPGVWRVRAWLSPKPTWPKE